MHVWLTGPFRDDVERFGSGGEIDSFMAKLDPLSAEDGKKLLQKQSIGPYFKHVLKGGSLRAFGRIVQVGEEELACLIRILHRNSSNCDDFYDDPVDYGDQWFEPLVDKERKTMQAALDEMRDEEPDQGPAPLPDECRPWLRRTAPDSAGDLLVYESLLWVEKVADRDFNDYWMSYHRILDRLISETGEEQAIQDLPGAVLARDPDPRYPRSILAVRVLAKEGGDHRRVLLLLAAHSAEPRPEDCGGAVRAVLGDNLPSPPEVVDEKWLSLPLERVARVAYRCYPAYLVLDDVAWLAIQREGAANLALSPEEEDLLRGLSLADGSPLPIFVNGQAGSGKSTMLRYVFADYLHRKKLDPTLPGEPMFLACNERLLHTAREEVERLLKSHARYVLPDEGQAGGELGTKVEWERHFQTFQTVVLELLPPECQEGFPPDRHVTFHRFRRLYAGSEVTGAESAWVLQLPERKRFSPELCWYAIRTFIKGTDPTRHLDPEGYRKLPKRDRTLSPETFEAIHDTIWKQWYRPMCMEGDFWDDQDLVRAALDPSLRLKAGFPAIFCDEAQDFTRIELRLIMRLFLLARYDVSSTYPDSIPLMFAGDPLQTLNPTGFRWESLGRAFYEEVLQEMDVAQRFPMDNRFVELSYNYRSTAPIVRLLNLIQLWRAGLFDLQHLLPQRPWRLDKAVEPRKYVLGRDVFLEDLQGTLQNTVLIVPTEEGAELDFLRRDRELSQVFDLANDELPRNVFSPISAKGLEFEKIILYKFGDQTPPQVWGLMNTTGPTDWPVEHEHFFNKLYVAASRARRDLLVLETPEGDGRLWSHLEDPSSQELLLTRLKKRQAWEGSFGGLLPGTRDTVADLREDNPLAIAKELHDKGMFQASAELLWKASQFYKQAGYQREARLCLAWSLRFSAKLTAAAKLFEELAEFEEARACLWEGEHWKQLSEWYQAHPDARKAHEGWMIAAFFTAPDTPESLENTTTELESWLQAHRPARVSVQWQHFVEALCRRVAAVQGERTTPKIWNTLAACLEQLDTLNFPDALAAAARCYYRGGSFPAATRCWERAGVVDHVDYYRAKSETTSPPDRLTWLRRAGDPGRIVEEWDQNERPESPEWLKEVAPALLQVGRVEEALNQYMAVGDWRSLLGHQDRLSSLAVDQRVAIQRRLLPLLLSSRQWGPALDLLKDLNDRMEAGEEGERTGFDVIRSLITHQVWRERTGPGVQQKVDHLVRKLLAEKESPWRRYLSFSEAGVAVERLTTLYVVAVRHYQWVLDSRPPHAELEAARRRWLRSMLRMAARLDDRGKPEQKELASQHRARVEAFEKRWQIEVRTVPEWPEDDPFVAAADRPAATARGGPRDGVPSWVPHGVSCLGDGPGRWTIKHDSFEIRVDQNLATILLIEQTTLSTLRVQARQAEVSGEGLQINKRPDGTCDFERKNPSISGRIVLSGTPRVDLRVGGLELKIPFPAPSTTS